MDMWCLWKPIKKLIISWNKRRNKDGMIQHFHKNKYNLVPCVNLVIIKQHMKTYGFMDIVITSQEPTLEFEYAKQSSASKKYTQVHTYN